MRKFILFILILATVRIADAQGSFVFSSSNAYLVLSDSNTYHLNGLYLVNGISSTDQLTYSGSGSVAWTSFDGSVSSNQNSLYVQSDMGYKAVVDGTDSYYFYVIDYALYPITISGLDFAPSDDICSTIVLNPTLSVPNLVYEDKYGNSKTLPRIFSLVYNQNTYTDPSWGSVSETQEFTYPFTQLSVDAPLCNTTYTLSGDQYARMMGVDSVSYTSPEYQVEAVKCYPTGSVEERTAKNEKDRSSSTQIEGSGPLVVNFESRANSSTYYFEWLIWNKEAPENYVRYNDENFRYTFQKTGTYYAKLTVNSDYCQFTDSLLITVDESFIDVPNAFTPNGDGYNDEFRVAYKSLAKYECWVYNRWGRLVYHSTDPGLGWDGRINGKKAAEGTYYYIITAIGTDKLSNGKQRTYKLSGDINLMR